MTEMEQIAESLARALGLEDRKDDGWWEPGYYLWRTGSNVFSDHWCCRAMGWLLSLGHAVQFSSEGQHCIVTAETGHEYLDTPTQKCPAAEFPARAIHELMAKKG